MTYAAAEGSAPDTIMAEASKGTEAATPAQEKIAKPTSEAIETHDEEFPAMHSPPKIDRSKNKKNKALPSQSENDEITETNPFNKSDLPDKAIPSQSEQQANSKTNRKPAPTSTDQSVTSSIEKNPANAALINDGTYRHSIQWNPADFNETKETGALWNTSVVPVLKLLFDHPKAQLHAWDKNDPSVSQLNNINEFNVQKFLSPAISPAYSQRTFYFGARLCFGDTPPQVWLSNATTTTTMKEQNFRVSVLNSACDSGKLITAGYIFLKHPTMTHRHRYLQSLRSELPSSTPHFDILTHRKSPDDENIPHLAVRCGEKHILSLTEILSGHMSGQKRTAVFVGRLAFQKMGPAAVKQLFITHKNFIVSLIRILIPLMTNVDRFRQEHLNNGNVIERSMRQWAESLTDSRGKLMQCDVENGGKDRNAYLLAPRHHSEAVKTALKEYKERVHPFKHREQRFHAMLSPEVAGRPQEIYVPTHAVLSNISFLQECTAEEPSSHQTRSKKMSHKHKSPMTRPQHLRQQLSHN